MTEETTDNVIPLQVLTGGKDGTGENWLASLTKGTCFLSRPKVSPTNNPMLDEYHVVFKTDTTTLLYVNRADGTTMRPHVDTLRFSRTMELVKILGVAQEEEEQVGHETVEEEIQEPIGSDAEPGGESRPSSGSSEEPAG